MQPKRFPLQRLAVAVALSAVATGGAQAGGIAVSNAWIRALPSDVSSAGYFTLYNGTGKQIVLVDASSPACGMLMLHKTKTAGGMASMEDVPSIPIAAGAHLSFAPGGYHLMCMEPSNDMKIGARVPVTLTFADGLTLTQDFSVHGVGGQ